MKDLIRVFLVSTVVALNLVSQENRDLEKLLVENKQLKERVHDLEHKFEMLAQTALQWSSEDDKSGSSSTSLASLGGSTGAAFRPNFQRKKLLYKKISKTGCSTLAAMFRGIMDTNATIIKEADSINRSTLEDYFVVSSVRNPCEWHLSWAAYETRGQLQNCLKASPMNGKIAFSHDEDFFANWDRVAEICPDVETGNKAFDTGLRKHKGLFTSILKKGLSIPGKPEDMTEGMLMESAHCWIRTEDIYEDMKFCLQKFEKAGGYVDWSKYSPKLIPRQQNQSPHGECEAQYKVNRDYSKIVSRTEGAIMKAFNYQCCGSSDVSQNQISVMS